MLIWGIKGEVKCFVFRKICGKNGYFLNRKWFILIVKGIMCDLILNKWKFESKVLSLLVNDNIKG